MYNPFANPSLNIVGVHFSISSEASFIVGLAVLSSLQQLSDPNDPVPVLEESLDHPFPDGDVLPYAKEER